MDLDSRDTLLTLSIGGLLLFGVIFVGLIPSHTLTLIGYGLIVLALILIIVNVRDLVVRTDKKGKN